MAVLVVLGMIAAAFLSFILGYQLGFKDVFRRYFAADIKIEKPNNEVRVKWAGSSQSVLLREISGMGDRTPAIYNVDKLHEFIHQNDRKDRFP